MKVAVGLDLSTKAGVAGPDWFALVKAPEKPKNLPLTMHYSSILERRDKFVHTLFETVADKHFQVDLWVMEGPAFAAKGQMDILYAFWWEVYYQLWEWKQSVAVVPPATLKSYALGYTDKKKNAERVDRSKGAMLQQATRFFTHAGQYDDNIADALFLMAMGMDFLGCPIIKAPGPTALGKVQWPKTG